MSSDAFFSVLVIFFIFFLFQIGIYKGTITNKFMQNSITKKGFQMLWLSQATLKIILAMNSEIL